MTLEDSFGQPVGVGDVIVYATMWNSRPVLTRAEVLEISEVPQKPYDDYRMKVMPEAETGWVHGHVSKREAKAITLKRAPFLLIAHAVTFEEYRAKLLERYEEVQA